MTEAAEQQEAPSRAHPAKRAGAAGLGLVAALGGIWLFRAPLGEAALRQAFARDGVESDFDLVDIGFGGASLHDLRLGPARAPDLRARRVEVRVAWRGLAPRLDVLGVQNAVLRVRIDEHGVSFGQLDAMFDKAPKSKEPALPAFALDLRNVQVVADTAIGQVRATGAGAGRPNRDFAARLIVQPGDLSGAMGSGKALRGDVRISTRGRQLIGAALFEAENVAFSPPGAQGVADLRAVRLEAAGTLPLDLSGADLQGRLTSAGGALGDFRMGPATFEARLKAEPFGPGFEPEGWNGEALLQAGPLSGPDLGVESVRLEASARVEGASAAGGYALGLGGASLAGIVGRKVAAAGPFSFDFAGGEARATAGGIATAPRAGLDPAVRRTLERWLSAPPDTPLAPLLSDLRPKLDRALQRFAMEIPFSFSWTLGRGRLSIAGPATLEAASGARLVVGAEAGTAPLGVVTPTGVPDGGARIALSGGGLPEATLVLAKLRGGGERPLEAEARLALQDWRAGSAALSLPDLRLTLQLSPGGGTAAARGQAVVSGPLVGFALGDARAPLNLTARWGKGFRVAPAGPGCTPLAVRRLEGLGVLFEAAAFDLCPLQGGAFVAGDAAGALSGGFAVSALALPGRTADDRAAPVRLTAERVEAVFSGSPAQPILDARIETPALSLDYPARGKAPAHRAELAAEAIAVRYGALEAGWRVSGAVTGGAARDTAQPLRLEALSLPFEAFPDSGGVVVRAAGGAARLFDPAARPVLNALALTAITARLEQGAVRAEGQISLQGAGSALGAFEADHRLASAAGQARLMVRDLAFTPGFQPHHVAEAARGRINAVSGPIDADLLARWSPDRLATSGRLALRDVSFTTPALGAVEGVRGELTFEDLAAGATPKGQTLAIRRLDPGIAAEDGIVRFQIAPGGVVALESAHWPFAGGVLSADPARIDLDQEETRLSLRLRDVDLGALIEALEVDGLDATGRAEGSFPVIFTPRGGRVEGARLTAAPGGGYIFYAGAGGQRGRAGSDAASQGRARLRYQDLTLELDGALKGEVVTEIRFAGRNRAPIRPAARRAALREAGVPFKFTMTVRAPFFALARPADEEAAPTRASR